VPHKLDIGVPLAALPRFLDELPRIVDGVAPGARTILWGHLGDGNMHVNILGAEPDDEHVDAAVLRLVLACGGTISAEHGTSAPSHSDGVVTVGLALVVGDRTGQTEP
jgi:FAD/FMN-containing dehydrogenase